MRVAGRGGDKFLEGSLPIAWKNRSQKTDFARKLAGLATHPLEPYPVATFCFAQPCGVGVFPSRIVTCRDRNTSYRQYSCRHGRLDSECNDLSFKSTAGLKSFDLVQSSEPHDPPRADNQDDEADADVPN